MTRKCFWAFMDLEKAYDRIEKQGLWTVLRQYGIDGRLLKGVKSFVRIVEHVYEWGMV